MAVSISVSNIGQMADTEITGSDLMPRPGESRWVQCRSYRCLATLEKDGKWRAFVTGKELTDIIEVFPE